MQQIPSIDRAQEFIIVSIQRRSDVPASVEKMEARIIALEYLVNILIDCLSDKGVVDGAKISRLLQSAAEDPRSASSNLEVPRSLMDLSERTP